MKIKKLNTKQAKSVERALKKTYGHCPCAIERNEDTKCICKHFREQTKLGKCFCGLYEKIKE